MLKSRLLNYLASNIKQALAALIYLLVLFSFFIIVILGKAGLYELINQHICQEPQSSIHQERSSRKNRDFWFGLVEDMKTIFDPSNPVCLGCLCLHPCQLREKLLPKQPPSSQGSIYIHIYECVYIYIYIF